MPIKKWGVAKVKGSEPEKFFIFLTDMEDSRSPNRQRPIKGWEFPEV
jgi:hypothetical protein